MSTPSARGAASAVHLDHVTKRFGTGERAVVAVDDLSFDIAPGEVFGVIGANGAGKTTTMRMLIDILHPSSGRIAVLGQHPREGGAALRSRIGYLPGELKVAGRIAVGTLLEHYAALSGNAAVSPVRRDELCARFGLDPSRTVGHLSKGNKQKLGIVQAFQHDPELLILDEPTSGLDPLLQAEFLALVREARDRGATVFLSSHVLSEIEHVADRVAVLAHGKLVELSDVEGLRATTVRRVHARIALGERHAATAGIAAIEATFAGLPHSHDVSVTPLGEGGDRVAVTFTIDGDINPVIQALAGYTLADLRIDEPDLEEAVLSMYDVGTGSRHTGSEARPETEGDAR